MPGVALLICFALFCALFVQTESRGIWGSRKRRSADEDEEEEVAPRRREPVKRPPSGFERELEANSAFGGLNSGLNDLMNNGGAMGGTASATQMKTMFDNVIDVMEQFIDMPEFDEHFNPGKVRDMVDMIPGLGDNEEVLAALSSPQFQDKELLKVTVREGLRSLREYTGQLAEMLTNPQALEGLISNLPPDMQNMIRGVLNGDMSGVKQMLASVPGMNPATVEMVSKMLDGDMSSMVDNLQSILGNPENVEQSRQHLLKNPEMAEAMGIPAEVLHDQEKWEALVDEGKTQLGDNMGEGKESGGAFAEHPNAM